MRLHHINCASLSPRAGGPLVCHCLLVEVGPSALVLVDTGLGLDDVRRPRPRIAALTLALLRPRLSEDETAVEQVRRLGRRPEDVRHVVLTHLDCDHAGGVEDFPDALVHVHRAELDAALDATSAWDRMRYRPSQWAGLGSRWRTHRPDGATWRGLRTLEQGDLPAGIRMVELPGHTWGHCGVVVELGERTLLHAGDAYFRRCEMTASTDRTPVTLRLTEVLDRVDARAWTESRAALRSLVVDEPRVQLFCAHDPAELSAMQRGDAAPLATTAGGRAAEG